MVNGPSGTLGMVALPLLSVVTVSEDAVTEWVAGAGRVVIGESSRLVADVEVYAGVLADVAVGEIAATDGLPCPLPTNCRLTVLVVSCVMTAVFETTVVVMGSVALMVYVSRPMPVKE